MLQVGDTVGPANVALPATDEVVWAPARTAGQRLAIARGIGVDVSLRSRNLTTSVETTIVTAANATVHVRRWQATATITRANGTVVARSPAMLLRMAGDAATPVRSISRLLNIGDFVTWTAP
jgi:hypothetical protein